MPFYFHLYAPSPFLFLLLSRVSALLANDASGLVLKITQIHKKETDLNLQISEDGTYISLITMSGTQRFVLGIEIRLVPQFSGSHLVNSFFHCCDTNHADTNMNTI